VNLGPGVASARRVLIPRLLRRERRGAVGVGARRLWPAVAVAVALQLPGCVGDVTPPRPPLRDQATLRVVTSTLPAFVNTLVVEVSASDITPPLIFNIAASGGTASGTIAMPAGSARTVTIKAYDAGAIETHRGSKTIDVQPGANPSVSIALMPIAGTQPIDVRLESLIITVTPATGSLRVDQTITGMLQASVATTGGTPVPVGPNDIRWATLQPSIATVGVDGSVTGVAAGTATVVAVYQGFGGAATITVQPAPILMAAGDIAKCVATLPPPASGEWTAKLLDTEPTATVAVVGDGTYEEGSLAQYTGCYDLSWGRHKARTKPAAGNHEYRTAGAAGYFDYFNGVGNLEGPAGERGKGYYSYDLGAWHVVVLNSNPPDVSMSATSPQITWLKADLAASSAKCTLIYFHHPRFSSGNEHGAQVRADPVWRAAYPAKVDVILGAHDHNYERFAKQTPDSAVDALSGIRQFVVGTGGYDLQGIRGVKVDGVWQPLIARNSEVRIPAEPDSTFGTSNDPRRRALKSGVLKLELRERSYRWWFIQADGTSQGTVLDQGSTECHW
jgi:hypothetical protein